MPEENTSLSMESALTLMRESRGTPATDEKPAATDTAPKEPEEKEQATAPAAEAAEGAEQNAPGDEGNEEGDAETGDALPPIEAPSSWKAEDKAAFSKLPRDAQEIIHRREQQRDTELRNLQNKSAESQKTVEAEVTKLAGLNNQINQYVNSEVAKLASDFPELKSEADVQALAVRDPARFAQFQARLMTFQSARQAQAEAQAALQQKANQQQQEYLGNARNALLAAFPQWKDPAVAQKEVTELQDYVIKTFDAPEAQVRSNLDPIAYKLAQKAMLYDRAQAAKADAVKRDPPKVVKAGTKSSTPRADAKAADRQSRLDRLSQSGSIEDAIGLLRM